MARILLIEDDSTIADGIVLGLKSHGMMVDWFGDAKQGEMALQDGMFDAVLLDLTLPKGDGMTVLKNWREKHIDTPVLIITARDAIANHMDGFNVSANVELATLEWVALRAQLLSCKAKPITNRFLTFLRFNKARLHSTVGYVSPFEFERRYILKFNT